MTNTTPANYECLQVKGQDATDKLPLRHEKQTLKIGKLLGKGSYALAFRAEYGGAHVALKVLHPELWLPKGTPWTQFKAEARYLMELEHR